MEIARTAAGQSPRRVHSVVMHHRPELRTQQKDEARVHRVGHGLEAVEVETNLLLNDAVPVTHDAAARKDTVGGFAFGAVRDVPQWHGLEAGVGVAVSLYAVPQPLTITHGRHPVSFQLFVRVRPPAGAMGRMWNMRMSQPMLGHAMTQGMHH